MRFGREALDQACGAAAQGDDPAAVGVDFVDPSDALAVERADDLVAQVGQPHHIAPQRGIHVRALSSVR